MYIPSDQDAVRKKSVNKNATSAHPFHLRGEVEKEINRLLEADIIGKVDEPTDWVSPVVVSNKPNGDIRLCADMTELSRMLVYYVSGLPRILVCYLSGLFLL